MAAKLPETSNEEKVIKVWKQLVHSDRNIPNNKPEIILQK
jgi:hypothetical protein